MSAKEIELRAISSKDANACIRRYHYSGSVVNNSQLHIGVFYRGRLEGAMQFGPSLDKRKIMGLVAGTLWNGFLELNRMAFSANLPRNSESRAISVAMRMIRKYAPHVQWVVSFADGAQCGDGAIYRASGFVLTGVSRSENLIRRGDGAVIHKMTLESNPTAPRAELGGRSYYDVTGGKYDLAAYARHTNGRVIPGFQLRYIYFIDLSAKERLTVPSLPFSEIERVGAGMYKGKPVSRLKEHDADTLGLVGGATPTQTLQFEDGTQEAAH